tara:strand:- start:55944 stop:56171 length:228 start_codon:yes stop_codon:yes gene_type:complete
MILAGAGGDSGNLFWGSFMNLMNENVIVLVICIVGFCLLGFGFTNRDRNWGVVLMWIGVVTMLGPIAWRLLTLFA